MTDQVGRTQDAGWQAGASRTVPVPAEVVWDFIVSPAGIGIWLGVTALPSEPGRCYKTVNGTVGEVRSYRRGDRVRLTWKPADRQDAATYQIALRPTTTGCSIVLHLERLSSREERGAMKARLADIADRLRDELS